MEYTTLLLDADGTLLDFPQDMENAFMSLYNECFRAQRPYSPAFLPCYERCNDRWWKKLEQGLCTKQELYVGRFVDFLAETGLTGVPEALTQAYFRYLGQGGAVYPGALEFVQAASRRYALYIVTNGNAATQKTRLENSGLMQWVKEFFVSEDAGAAKPDPRYFEYVFARIPGLEKGQALVIGDSLTSDIQGAVNFGLDSLYYHPGAPAAPGPYTYEAGSYDGIKEALGL